MAIRNATASGACDDDEEESLPVLNAHRWCLCRQLVLPLVRWWWHGRTAPAGSMSAAAAAAADERAQAQPYTSRCPGVQAKRDAQAAGLAGSGAIAGSANDGTKNATASGACNDVDEESEISGEAADRADRHEAQTRVSLLAAETAGAQAELKALKAEHAAGVVPTTKRSNAQGQANWSGLLISDVVVETRPSEAQLNQQALQHVHAHASTAPALSGWRRPVRRHYRTQRKTSTGSASPASTRRFCASVERRR
jgi:hypothetical protein